MCYPSMSTQAQNSKNLSTSVRLLFWCRARFSSKNNGVESQWLSGSNVAITLKSADSLDNLQDFTIRRSLEVWGCSECFSLIVLSIIVGPRYNPVRKITNHCAFAGRNRYCTVWRQLTCNATSCSSWLQILGRPSHLFAKILPSSCITISLFIWS